MILKQLIRYTNADALEATWVRYDQLPDVEVPASPALYDKDGNEVTIQVIAERINTMQNGVRDLKAMKVWKC